MLGNEIPPWFNDDEMLELLSISTYDKFLAIILGSYSLAERRRLVQESNKASRF